MTHDDEKQLRILGRLHYVAAALASVIPLIGAAYAAFGVAILLGKFPGAPPMKGESLGWLPVGMGTFFFSFGICAVVLNLLSARSLRDRKNHTLCVLTAAMNCMHLPLGTLLGVFTLMVLCRPAVNAAFKPPGNVPPPLPAEGSGGSLGPARVVAAG
ncbi:MAG TPA: hypothetical protein VGJ91_21440 [Polyangiaceae bacterium]